MPIESVPLSDGDYELVPASNSTPESASLNLTDLNKNLGQSPEEPKASSAQEGKPQCI
jgi:hypothetical protein